MSEEPKATSPAALTADEKRARIASAKRAAEEEETDRRLDADIARLELVERFTKELRGREGEQFAIYDASDQGEGFFVVKLGPAILWKTYWDSQMTDVDRCDLVSQCIVYPPKDEYLAARGRRPGIDAELTKRLGRLFGLDIKVDQKK